MGGYWRCFRMDDILEGWRDSAACLGYPEPFFPAVGGSSDLARRICETCSVREECLDYALRSPSATRAGIWAGYTERELRELRRLRSFPDTETGFF